MTSYMSENDAKNLQNSYVHLTKMPDFGMGYFENHFEHCGESWLIFYIFHAFHLSLIMFFTSASL